MNLRLADTAITAVAALATASVVAAIVELLGPADGLAARATPAAQRPLVDLAPVIRLAPFGTTSTTPADTRGLSLRGVMLARPAAASTALIASAGGRTAAYGIGETLPGGAVLDTVEYDLVTLRADGAIVTLGFPMARDQGPDAQPTSPGDVGR